MPFFENVHIAADTVIFRSSIPKNQQVRPCARDAHAAKFSLKKHRELKKDFFNLQKPPLYSCTSTTNYQKDNLKLKL